MGHELVGAREFVLNGVEGNLLGVDAGDDISRNQIDEPAGAAGGETDVDPLFSAAVDGHAQLRRLLRVGRRGAKEVADPRVWTIAHSQKLVTRCPIRHQARRQSLAALRGSFMGHSSVAFAVVVGSGNERTKKMRGLRRASFSPGFRQLQGLRVMIGPEDAGGDGAIGVGPL